jgi:hypothetical protein
MEGGVKFMKYLKEGTSNKRLGTSDIVSLLGSQCSTIRKAYITFHLKGNHNYYT